MGICIACGKSCPPHRFAGRPCDEHANEVCCNCWKQHLYIEVIINKTSDITCVQCHKMINEAQFKQSAKITQEYLITLKAVAATLEEALVPVDSAKILKSGKKETVKDHIKRNDGEKLKADEVEEDDWQVIGEDDM